MNKFTLQGLCLVDWGRGIDKSLFPDKMKFKGDCRTSGFRCIEMQENKPWTFQASFISKIMFEFVIFLIYYFMTISTLTLLFWFFTR